MPLAFSKHYFCLSATALRFFPEAAIEPSSLGKGRFRFTFCFVFSVNLFSVSWKSHVLLISLFPLFGKNDSKLSGQVTVEFYKSLNFIERFCGTALDIRAESWLHPVDESLWTAIA